MSEWRIGFRSSNGYTSIAQDGHTIFSVPDRFAEQIVADHQAASATAGEAQAQEIRALRDGLAGVTELIHDSYGHERGKDGCYEDCFVCEADLIIDAALSTGARAEGQDE